MPSYFIGFALKTHWKLPESPGEVSSFSVRPLILNKNIKIDFFKVKARILPKK